jgi:hypothetical protein
VFHFDIVSGFTKGGPRGIIIGVGVEMQAELMWRHLAAFPSGYSKENTFTLLIYTHSNYIEKGSIKEHKSFLAVLCL